MVGATIIVEEVFADLDYADDVSLQGEMAEVLLRSLVREAKAFGVEINCDEDKNPDPLR